LVRLEGLANLHKELLVEIPQIEVTVDLEKAQKYGLKPGDVRRAAAYVISAEETGDLYSANRVVGVWVWSPPETRQNLSNIRDLLIDTPNGGKVRLSEVANGAPGPCPQRHQPRRHGPPHQR